MSDRDHDENWGLDSEMPPEGCQHYADFHEMPWDIRKCVLMHTLPLAIADGIRYYHQRYSIFSKYDEGIWMTEDAWFGVTPEPVAK